MLCLIILLNIVGNLFCFEKSLKTDENIPKNLSKLNEKSFVDDVFDNKYAKKLDTNKSSMRSSTFRSAFGYLESFSNKNFVILETGCVRHKDNYASDGFSTIIFDNFVNFYDGSVLSFDINPNAVELANNYTSEKTKVICKDSVKGLYEYAKDDKAPLIDLLYLDSFDIDWKNPHPSSFHHMKEFLAIQTKLKKGTLVMVDDHKVGKGKGRYIEMYMDNIGISPFFKEYQIGWIIK